MRQPPQPKRLGELLKLACTLIGDLPAPRDVYVAVTGQAIELGFDGTRAGIRAMTEWSRQYHCPLSGEQTTLDDGTVVIRCRLVIERTDGVRVEGRAYVRAADIAAEAS
jgi:hypothetical protein